MNIRQLTNARAVIELLIMLLCLLCINCFVLEQLVLDQIFAISVFLLIPSILSWVIYRFFGFIFFIITERRMPFLLIFIIAPPLGYAMFHAVLYVVYYGIVGVPDY